MKKIMSILLVAMILLLGLPALADDLRLAPGPPPDTSITISNQRLNGDEFIIGAKYHLSQKEGALSNGSYGPKDPTLVKGFSFQVGVDGQVLPAEFENYDITIETIGHQTKISHLPYGTYKLLLEEPPVGYIRPPHPNDRYVIVDLPTTEEDGSLNYHMVVNPKLTMITGDIHLTKKSIAMNLPGAVFDIFYSFTGEADSYTPWIPEGGTTNQMQTSAEGKIDLIGVPYGYYKFKEVTAPDGFMLTNEEFMAAIGIEDGNRFTIVDKPKEYSVDLVVENFEKPLIEKTYSSALVAPGGTMHYKLNTILPGDIDSYKSFVITDTLDHYLAYKDGSITIKNGLNEDISSYFTTTVEGQLITITCNNIPALLAANPSGVSSVDVEFDADILVDIPGGYLLRNDFTLTAVNRWDVPFEETTGVEVTLPNNTLILHKVDGNTRESLQGVNFKLERLHPVTEEYYLVSENNITNAVGDIKWENLPNGKYRLTELKPPAGYRVIDPVIVELDNALITEVNVKTLNVSNYKSNTYIPNTGTLGALGFISVGAGLFVLSRVLKKKEVED